MAWQATDKFMVLGRSGCGKSTLGNLICDAYPRVVTFDSLHEYSNGTVVSNFDSFARFLIDAGMKKKNNFHLIYQFDIENENNAEEFNEALRVLYYFGGVFVRIEEIQNFTSTHFLPHWLTQCLTTGRHRRIGMLFLTQIPGLCNKRLISQAGHVFCGQMHEKNDIEYVRSVLGDDAYQLKNIEPRKFLYFQPGKPITKVNNSVDTTGNSTPD